MTLIISSVNLIIAVGNIKIIIETQKKGDHGSGN